AVIGPKDPVFCPNHFVYAIRHPLGSSSPKVVRAPLYRDVYIVVLAPDDCNMSMDVVVLCDCNPCILVEPLADGDIVVAPLVDGDIVMVPLVDGDTVVDPFGSVVADLADCNAEVMAL
nr:hypothetical protein [Tanacetum cinerariifolium]